MTKMVVQNLIVNALFEHAVKQVYEKNKYCMRQKTRREIKSGKRDMKTKRRKINSNETRRQINPKQINPK
jgi:hypothetical protein